MKTLSILVMVLLSAAAPAVPTCWPAQVAGTGSMANFQTNSTGWAVVWKCPDNTIPAAIGSWAEMEPNWLTQLVNASTGGTVSGLWNKVTPSTVQQMQANYPAVFPLLQGLMVQASTPGAPQSVLVGP